MPIIPDAEATAAPDAFTTSCSGTQDHSHVAAKPAIESGCSQASRAVARAARSDQVVEPAANPLVKSVAIVKSPSPKPLPSPVLLVTPVGGSESIHTAGPPVKTPAKPAVKLVAQPAAKPVFKPVVQPVDNPATPAPVPPAKRISKPAARDSQVDFVYAEFKKRCTLSQDAMTRVHSLLQVIKEGSGYSRRQRQNSRDEIRLLVGNHIWKHYHSTQVKTG